MPTALFSYGFRPFFLAASAYGCGAMAVWLALYGGGFSLPIAVSGSLWHGHEMLFGYGTAVLAGFLLTVTPNWSGATPHQGRILMLLAGVWAIGRLAYWLSGLLPVWVVAVADLAFLPALLAIIAPPLMTEKTGRQRVFLLIVVLLFAANLFTHLDMLGVVDGGFRPGLLFGANIFILLITLLGGRIIPGFTANIQRRAGGLAGVRSPAFVSRAAIVLTVLYGAAELAGEGSALVGGLALAAAVAHAVRLVGWQPFSTLKHPILWILHLGYFWIVIGLALKGAAAFTDVIPPASALHALTAGAVGTVTMAVMSRASLGHTGREIVAPGPIVAAYGLITAAALLRVAAPAIAPDAAALAVVASALLWTAAFALFVVVYAPILVRPRIDARR